MMHLGIIERNVRVLCFAFHNLILF
jgi:hypothetical protein